MRLFRACLLFLFIGIIFLSNSCNTSLQITKRRYRPGYYVNANSNKSRDKLPDISFNDNPVAENIAKITIKKEYEPDKIPDKVEIKEKTKTKVRPSLLLADINKTLKDSSPAIEYARYKKLSPYSQPNKKRTNKINNNDDPEEYWDTDEILILIYSIGALLAGIICLAAGLPLFLDLISYINLGSRGAFFIIVMLSSLFANTLGWIAYNKEMLSSRKHNGKVLAIIGIVLGIIVVAVLLTLYLINFIF